MVRDQVHCRKTSGGIQCTEEKSLAVVLDLVQWSRVPASASEQKSRSDTEAFWQQGVHEDDKMSAKHSPPDGVRDLLVIRIRYVQRRTVRLRGNWMTACQPDTLEKVVLIKSTKFSINIIIIVLTGNFRGRI